MDGQLTEAGMTRGSSPTKSMGHASSTAFSVIVHLKKDGLRKSIINLGGVGLID